MWTCLTQGSNCFSFHEKYAHVLHVYFKGGGRQDKYVTWDIDSTVSNKLILVLLVIKKVNNDNK
jgi:hypothetical protein